MKDVDVVTKCGSGSLQRTRERCGQKPEIREPSSLWKKEEEKAKRRRKGGGGKGRKRGWGGEGRRKEGGEEGNSNTS